MLPADTATTGQMLSLMRTLGEVPGFLRAFAAERLLADPDLTQEYRLAPNKQEYYVGVITTGSRLPGQYACRYH